MFWVHEEEGQRRITVLAVCLLCSHIHGSHGRRSQACKRRAGRKLSTPFVMVLKGRRKDLTLFFAPTVSLALLLLWCCAWSFEQASASLWASAHYSANNAQRAARSPCSLLPPSPVISLLWWRPPKQWLRLGKGALWSASLPLGLRAPSLLMAPVLLTSDRREGLSFPEIQVGEPLLWLPPSPSLFTPCWALHWRCGDWASCLYLWEWSHLTDNFILGHFTLLPGYVHTL